MSEYAPACAVHPVQGTGPGHYLVSSNGQVEAGPFSTPEAAEAHALWLEDQSLGVNPSPWDAVESERGLLIGSRYRAPRGKSRAGTKRLDTTPRKV